MRSAGVWHGTMRRVTFGARVASDGRRVVWTYYGYTVQNGSDDNLHNASNVRI